MNINFDTATSRDFINIPGKNVLERAQLFSRYLEYLDNRGLLNYRIKSVSGCGPTMDLSLNGNVKRDVVSFVSNDYLGFTRHPKIKQSVIKAIEKFGTGGGASPLIGGLHHYHEELEAKTSAFFGFSADHAISYTTGYTANSAPLLCLLQTEDVAIVDMAVHASVLEGVGGTNVLKFLHNDLYHLERNLKMATKYRTKMVVVDGVYSQDGDIALLPEIISLAKKYDALVMVDDAHGIGVVGDTGRGAAEQKKVMNDVDILTGTYSKSLGNIGGFVISSPEIISLLKYQSNQHIFSSTAGPATAGIVKALNLIDEEPEWKHKLWDNITYYREGLKQLGFDIGNTESAVIPVKIGDTVKTSQASALLLEAGIYANPIQYPAVSVKNSRIRMSVMATHTKAHLDIALNAFEYVDKKLDLTKANR